MPCKRILVLSFYYPPEVSAGAFRVKAMVDALDKESSEEYQIDVMTASPANNKLIHTEQFGSNSQHRILRIGVPEVDDSYLGCARKFIVFATGVMRLVKKNNYDLVIASSSRLMTGILGAYIAKRSMAKYIYDMRDLFVENMAWVMPRGMKFLGRFVFGMLERYAVNNAVMTNLVSPGFVEYFVEHYPQALYTTYTNGIDSIFTENVDTVPISQIENKHGKLNIVYAGNIGLAQCLDRFVPEFADALKAKVHLMIIGSGRGEGELTTELERRNVQNVTFIPNVSRKELVSYYKKADVLLLHIDGHPALKKVLPSKLFEYGAMGKPILAGVSGYAEEFITQNIANAACFKPCDTKAAIMALDNLFIGYQRRDDFIESYERKVIMKKMGKEIIDKYL